MTIGEKITALRTQKKMSQEQLAEALNVSRQSVSKWEMDAALPQVDKILQLCSLFSISADALLRDEVLVSGGRAQNKYFGTDGFRGEANVGLTSMHAYKVGRFLGWYYSSSISGQKNPAHKVKIVIGKDTRRSSYMLEYSIVAGITASGADAYMLHVTTTPSISYVTRQDEFDCGIMITASHNPFYDNGIKLINKYGEKLDDKTTSLIEAYLDGNLEAIGLDAEDLPLAKREKIGQIVDYVSGRNRYMGYLLSIASHSYKKLKIGLDCANGASWQIAKAVFGALGASCTVLGDEPNGLNVNENCGSTYIESLRQLVLEKHLDLGFAFDGDGDRCIAVDENGNVVDGDAILYILAKRLKRRGMLNKNTVVCTVMSNSGFVNALEKEEINCIQTAVGDRFVYCEMQNNDYSLGGENSGHIIAKKYATTGDGILTAILLAEEVCDRKTSLLGLCEGLTLYPQHCGNRKVGNKEKALSDPEVLKRKREVEGKIGKMGRVLLRESGTEPVIRIMVECESKELAENLSLYIAEAVKEGGHLA